MKNQTIQMANQVLAGYPLLRDRVKYVLTAHATSPKVTGAIYGLLRALEKTSVIGDRKIRHFRPTLQRVLLRLALQCPPGDFLRPQQYSNLNATDFSILSRWGLILAGPKKGQWAPTRLAFHWLTGRVPIIPALRQSAPDEFQAILSEPIPVAQDLREFKDPTVAAQLQDIKNKWYDWAIETSQQHPGRVDAFLHPNYWNSQGNLVKYQVRSYQDQFQP